MSGKLLENGSVSGGQESLERSTKKHKIQLDNASDAGITSLNTMDSDMQEAPVQGAWAQGSFADVVNGEPITRSIFLGDETLTWWSPSLLRNITAFLNHGEVAFY